jgi:hypothetical protein
MSWNTLCNHSWYLLKSKDKYRVACILTNTHLHSKNIKFVMHFGVPPRCAIELCNLHLVHLKVTSMWPVSSSRLMNSKPLVDHSKAFLCTACGWGFLLLFWGYLPSRTELKPPYNYLNFKNGPFVCTLSLLILSKSLQFFLLYILFK